MESQQQCWNSGGAWSNAPPSLTARRRDLPEKWWVRLSFCSSSLLVVPITVTCKKKHKTQQQSNFILFCF